MKNLITSIILLLSYTFVQSQVKTKFNIGSFEYIIEEPYSNNNYEVSIKKYNDCPIGTLIIPETVYCSDNNKTYKIIGIADNAFIDCINLNEIVFPKNLESIGETAFKNTGLLNIIYPKGLNKIGNGVFSKCEKLKSVIVEEGVINLGNNTFYWCINLTNVILPNSLKSLGYGNFSACKGLKYIKLPNSITKIGSNNFSGCSNLENVILPDSLKKLRYNTFSGCNSLKDIILPNSLESIESSNFSDCKSLEKIIIPLNVQNIGDYAFYNCKALKSVEVNVLNPITINKTVFKDVPIYNIPLLVPNGSEALYKNSNIWKEFLNITALSTKDSFNNLMLNLYPNPTSKQISVQLNNSILKNITIYNNLGQVIKSTKELTINTSNLSKGIYFIEIETNKGKASKKLVIE
jgi:hypothetical protein